MEDCELCGRKTEAVNIVEVESVEFRVCQKCTEGKKLVYKHQLHDNARHRNPEIVKKEPEYLLVQNYGEKIRKAREKLDLPLKVVAEMLNEKHSLLLRVEEERTKPTPVLLKKLERFLGVSLVENPQDGESLAVRTGAAGSATVGEFIN